MILLTILIFTLLALLLAVIFSITILGVGTILMFSDIIVCGLIIGWIIKKLFFKKKRES